MDRAETLQQLARLCRGDRDGFASPSVAASGVSALDAILPGGGWRAGTVIELMPTAVGIGELRLLMPALARLTQADRYIALVSPPFIPYAPALSQHGLLLERLIVIQVQSSKDALWSAEQTLRCRSFGAVIAWPSSIVDRDIRRLQLAAEAGASICFLYRPHAAARESSPAAVRLRLHADNDDLHIDVIKCRGARSGVSLRTPLERKGKRTSPPTRAYQRSP